jgi:hypothetical protein
MKQKDLKAGEFYYLEPYKGDKYIMQLAEVVKGRVPVIAYLCNEHYCSGSSNLCQVDEIERIATPQERAHLEACITAGKYVPPPETIQTTFYEIY